MNLPQKSYPTLIDMKNKILQNLPGDHPWQNQIIWLNSTDSTNIQAKKLALEGAPHGTAIFAGYQAAGRGRMGRSFSSPAGQGVYMSLVLRPNCKPQQLMHLTCAAAVAACKAVEKVIGIRPDIKWINDLVYQKRKLAGILTELVLLPDSTAAIIGIGINCCQKAEDFPEEIRETAGSLSMFTERSVEPAELAAALLVELERISRKLLDGKAEIMAFYRKSCITLGKEISVVQGNDVRHGQAIGLDEDGALTVRFSDGNVELVNSGEASIRGMYGYI